MTKELLTSEMNLAYDRLSYLIHNMDTSLFNKSILPDKWTIAGHINHLVLSMQPVNTAFRMPAFLLKYKFGVCNREERSFEALVQKYENKLSQNKVNAPSRFQPKLDGPVNPDVLLDKLGHEKSKMLKRMNKWTDAKLSTCVLPHPLLGKLTMREMVAFSILHMEHHRHVIKEKYL